MNLIQPSLQLVDVLSSWGLRESPKYPGIQVPSDKSQRAALGLEIVLRHVPVLVGRILLAEPLDPDDLRGAFRANFGPEDVTKLILHDGRRLDSVDWSSDKDVRRLIETPEPTPIVCTVQVAEDDPDGLVEPFAIFDGWHRAGAWLVSGRADGFFPLTAEIIRTRRPLIYLATPAPT